MESYEEHELYSACSVWLHSTVQFVVCVGAVCVQLYARVCYFIWKWEMNLKLLCFEIPKKMN